MNSQPRKWLEMREEEIEGKQTISSFAKPHSHRTARDRVVLDGARPTSGETVVAHHPHIFSGDAWAKISNIAVACMIAFVLLVVALTSSAIHLDAGLPFIGRLALYFCMVLCVAGLVFVAVSRNKK